MPIAAPFEPTPSRPSQEGVISVDAAQPSANRAEGTPPELARQDWTRMALGIVLAGTAYSLSVYSGWGLFSLFMVLSSRLLDEPSNLLLELIPSVLSVLFFGLVVAAIGSFWTWVVACVVVPLAYVFAWSLRLGGSIVWCGAVVGGLVGFVATVPVAFPIAYELSRGNVPIGSFLGHLLVVAVGPGLATIFGQIGGAWGGRYAGSREQRYQEALRRARYIPVRTETQLAEQPESSEGERRPWLQFGIRHMLWVAVWFSLLLSVMRLSGFDLVIVLPVLLGWFVYQLLTLWIGARLWLGWYAWQQGRAESLHVKQPVE